MCGHVRLRHSIVAALSLCSAAVGANINCNYAFRGANWMDWGGDYMVGANETFVEVEADRSTYADFDPAFISWLDVGANGFWDNNIATGPTGTFYVRGRLKYRDGDNVLRELPSNVEGPL